MIVNLGSRKYHITWKHLNDKTNAHKTGFTECLISVIQPDGIRKAFVQANARCSDKDQYSKNIGRKISLERALLTKVPDPNQAGVWVPLFYKEDRALIWTKYFMMRLGKY